MTSIQLVGSALTGRPFLLFLCSIFGLISGSLSTSLGSKCQHDMDCTDFIKGSSCSLNGYCECAPYFVQFNGTTCLSSQLLGGDCFLDEQCTMKVGNSSCLDGACRCVEGFLQFRKHTCLGPSHPGAVCYSNAHCQMFDSRTHCDFLIPNLFGRCQCSAPAKQYGGMCHDSSEEKVEAFEQVGQPSQTPATYFATTTSTSDPLPSEAEAAVYLPVNLITPHFNELTTTIKGDDDTYGKPEEVLDSSTEQAITQASVSTERDLVEHFTQKATVLSTETTASTEAVPFILTEEVASHQDSTEDYPYKIDEDYPEKNFNDVEKDTSEASVAEVQTTTVKPLDDADLERETTNALSQANQIYNMGESQLKDTQLVAEEVFETIPSDSMEMLSGDNANAVETHYPPSPITTTERVVDQDSSTYFNHDDDIIKTMTSAPHGKEDEATNAFNNEVIEDEHTEQNEHAEKHLSSSSNFSNNDNQLLDRLSGDEQQVTTVEPSVESDMESINSAYAAEQEAAIAFNHNVIEDEHTEQNEHAVESLSSNSSNDDNQMLHRLSGDEQQGTTVEPLAESDMESINSAYAAEQEAANTFNNDVIKDEHTEQNEHAEEHLSSSSNFSNNDNQLLHSLSDDEQQRTTVEPLAESDMASINSAYAAEQEAANTFNNDVIKDEHTEQNEHAEEHLSSSSNFSNNDNQLLDRLSGDEQQVTTVEPSVESDMESINSAYAAEQEAAIAFNHNVIEDEHTEQNEHEVENLSSNSSNDDNQLLHRLSDDEQQRTTVEPLAESDMESINSAYAAEQEAANTFNNDVIEDEHTEKNEHAEEHLSSSSNFSNNDNQLLDRLSGDEQQVTTVEPSVESDMESINSAYAAEQEAAIAFNHNVIEDEHTEQNEHEVENLSSNSSNDDNQLLHRLSDDEQQRTTVEPLAESDMESINSAYAAEQEAANTFNNDVIEDEHTEKNEHAEEHLSSNYSNNDIQMLHHLSGVEQQATTVEPSAKSDIDSMNSAYDADQSIDATRPESSETQQLDTTNEAAGTTARTYDNNQAFLDEVTTQHPETASTEKETFYPPEFEPEHVEDEEENEEDLFELTTKSGEENGIRQTTVVPTKVDTTLQTTEYPVEAVEQYLETTTDHAKEPIAIKHETLTPTLEPEWLEGEESSTAETELAVGNMKVPLEVGYPVEDFENIIEGSEPVGLQVASSHNDVTPLALVADDTPPTVVPATNHRIMFNESFNASELGKDEDHQAPLETIEIQQNVLTSDRFDYFESDVPSYSTTQKEPSVDTIPEHSIEMNQQVELDLTDLGSSLANNTDQGKDEINFMTVPAESDYSEVDRFQPSGYTELDDEQQSESEDRSTEHNFPEAVTSKTEDSLVILDEATTEADVDETTLEFEEDENLLTTTTLSTDTFSGSESSDHVFDYSKAEKIALQSTPATGGDLVDDLVADETRVAEETPVQFIEMKLQSAETEPETVEVGTFVTLGPDAAGLGLDDSQNSQITETPLGVPLPSDMSLDDIFHTELQSDNLVVDTTTKSDGDEEGLHKQQAATQITTTTTDANDILEITTQTMMALASRVTLMEPAAPVATTLEPFMITDGGTEDFTTTPYPQYHTRQDIVNPAKPTLEQRKRVELGNGPVSLGMDCVSDRQCQLADPNAICNARGVCDCAASSTSHEAKYAYCGAERTGCSEGTFQCRSSGVCISWFFVCDGRPDCTDASDEECTFRPRSNQTCPNESFHCYRSDRCISRAALCDGRKQCPHGEDELNCNSLKTGECPPNTFRCKSGECLPEYEYCNAIISCKDGSDEPPVLCGSRSVPNFYLRLLTSAALVGNDINTVNKNNNNYYYCPHKCSNGRCRSTAIVCSGRDGCGDGTDEQTCSVCRCPALPPARNVPSTQHYPTRNHPMPLW